MTRAFNRIPANAVIHLEFAALKPIAYIRILEDFPSRIEPGQTIVGAKPKVTLFIL
jgi:hypothetical protein